MRVIEEARRTIADDCRIVGRIQCGFEAIAIRAVGSRGELEQVHVSIDGEWCMITARAIEGPLPDTLMLTGPLLPRSPSLVSGVDDVLSSLEHWRDRLSDPETIGSTDHATGIRRDLSHLIRAVAQQFDNRWSQAIVRSRGTGRHHIQLRLTGHASGSTEMNFVSGTRRSGVGRMSRQLIDAIDGIVGDHTHVSSWNGKCPADRLVITIGSTAFIDVGDPGDHMANLRGCAIRPDGAVLIPSSTSSR
ncbi:hypothetical protein ASF14_01285 [Sphingomonas sp. Leaf257]|nr:hypothetical protein ASF14_01285 [Sphingomonas sp. Leaf257]